MEIKLGCFWSEDRFGKVDDYASYEMLYNMIFQQKMKNKLHLYIAIELEMISRRYDQIREL
jgi:hypothetical protein